jgi:hypothetical protein
MATAIRHLALAAGARSRPATPARQYPDQRLRTDGWSGRAPRATFFAAIAAAGFDPELLPRW